MFPRPSLTSHSITVSRATTGVDAEGTPLDTYEIINTFTGGFGELSTTKEIVLGFDGQRVDAAISTLSSPDVEVGDKIIADNRTWRVVGVRKTAITARILLATWGVK